MASVTIPFTTPVGRLVQGDLYEMQTKDQNGAPLVVKTGPNAGQPAHRYFIGVAFEKNNPEWPAFEQLLKSVAAQSFPALFPSGPAGPCVNPNFSMKIIDGDGVDQNGKPNREKPGFAGCWVVRFQSSFAPKLYPIESNTVEITEKGRIRRGYFVRVAGNSKGNDNAQRPGIYVNFSLVKLVGYGPEIVSGPSAADTFGAAPAGYVPAGMATTPVGGTMPAQPQAAAPAPAPAPAPQPYAGYIPQTPPTVPVHQMTAKAGQWTYEQMAAQGWTDDALRAEGYMV